MEAYENSIHFNLSIPGFIEDYLAEHGISTNEIPTTVSSKESLIDYLSSRGLSDAEDLVKNAVFYAYDQKYYKYYSAERDVHEYSDDWINDFGEILKKLDIDDKLNEMSIVNVGSNDASQMEKLISDNYKEMYLVDVGLRSLLLAKKLYPDAKIMHTDADTLEDIPDNSIDLYLSFRTFNSSIFNMKKATSELNRVLSDNGRVILSIPNGYVDANGNFTYGLIPPNGNSIDECYPFKILEKILYHLSRVGFKDIGIINSFYEIYIYTRR